jgi:hypothetical protein
VTFAIGKVTPLVALATSAGTPVFGQSVTLVATVSFGASTPGGSVTFYDGSAPLATVPIDTSGQAALHTTALRVGVHSITAAFDGDTGFGAGVSGPTTLSVSRAATEVLLVSQPIFKKKHKLVSLGLKAEVQPIAPGAGVPTGTVTFEIQGKVRKKVTERVLATLSLSGGSATLSVKPRSVLRKPITIVYGGDADFTFQHVASIIADAGVAQEPGTADGGAVRPLAKPSTKMGI